ncbi:hypothetical protein [Rubricoccus marinus]|uniref:Uncharacterized protein n=1 Tax=Rubricoccus marinus TaxID=716817 RepID=A0A259TZW5_9BACT|nr:hypothetical protein [Rubricoccus marinus]OZC03226.1 hypothetical protein BSZ36_09715 [Rubricoccus marinus]
MALSPADFDRIASALGVDPEREGDLVRFSLSDAASGRTLVLEIMPTTDDGSLVTVYSQVAHLQLQGCEAVVASEELGEALFMAREGARVSGLVVERGAGCSLYANVPERLLSADFTSLAPEVMQSAVVLSLGETMFE